MGAPPGPKTNTKHFIEWFFAEYGHRFSQSTVSESLSNTFAKLNEDPCTTALHQRAGLDNHILSNDILYMTIFFMTPITSS